MQRKGYTFKLSPYKSLYLYPKIQEYEKRTQFLHHNHSFWKSFHSYEKISHFIKYIAPEYKDSMMGFNI